MIKYKEFKIIDVLDWQSQKEISPLDLGVLSTDSTIKYPFYGQATINNGVISYQSLNESVLNNKEGKPTILIHSNNQNIVYLQTPFYLKDGHGATSVLQSENLNEKNALYIIACIKKVIVKKFSYNEKATKIALKNTLINLPVNESNQIDYKYMEKVVISLEKNRINKISSYLKRIGFDDLTLNERESSSLNRFRNDQIKYEEFKIVDIFQVSNTHSILKSDIVPESGDFPYVTAGEENNSISTYINYDKSMIELGNSIMIGGKTLVVTYQGDDYFSNDSHNLSLIIKDPKGRNRNTQLFLVAALKKSLKHLYSWSDSISKKKIQTDRILLPITNENTIDFDYMQEFIKAQEKLLFKKIFDWSSSKIFEQKDVV